MNAFLNNPKYAKLIKNTPPETGDTEKLESVIFSPAESKIGFFEVPGYTESLLKKAMACTGTDSEGDILDGIDLARKEALNRQELGASRMGGVPDVYPGFRWPTHKRKKLPFIMQVNLCEIEKKNKLLPISGFLYLFAWLGTDTAPNKIVARCLYHSVDNKQKLIRRSVKSVDMTNDWQGKCQYDYVAISQKITRSNTFSCPVTLFGSQDFAQEQNFKEDASDFLQGEDWLVLLSVLSSDTGPMWSDGGVLRVMIRRNDLVSRCFDRIVCYIDL